MEEKWSTDTSISGPGHQTPSFKPRAADIAAYATAGGDVQPRSASLAASTKYSSCAHSQYLRRQTRGPKSKIHSLIFFGNILGYLMLCLCCHGMERVPWRGGHGIVCSCILCDRPCRRCVYLYVVGNLMDHVCPDVPDVDPRHISSPNGSKFKPKYFARTFSFVVSTYRKKIDTVVGRRK